MAYPTVSAPYGLDPINRFDGIAYAGATQQLTIASTYNTAIYNGDIVAVVSGNIVKSLVTSNVSTNSSTATYGVFMGCQYVNSQGQTVQAQYYPGNASATSAIAYVVNDPVAEYKVAVTYSGNSTISSTTIAAIGTNAALIQGTGSATTGNSGVSLAAPAANAGNAAVLPVRIIAVVPATAANATLYTEVIVKLNQPQILVSTANDFA
ncbi:MAG: hypothetical protein RL373_55 [Pseudomonadota bacterium]|jgi:hypothetical protein